MISFDHDPKVTASLHRWRGKDVFPTDLGSAEIRSLSRELLDRAVFSARTTNAEYLQEVAHEIDECLAGRQNIATARWHLMRKLQQLGYDAATGFPGDMGNVPPAERDSLQDLSSRQRIDLMLRTNIALARNYGRAVGGNTEFARYAWPAWELVRLELRETPRGERRGKGGELRPDPEHGWPRRWEAAGESVSWEGAVPGTLIARKDSLIWQALANGAGGYSDTLGHPFPPFAFNSGMDWKAVPRKQWQAMEGETRRQGEGAAATSPTLPLSHPPTLPTFAPHAEEVTRVLQKLGPGFKAELLRELRQEAQAA